MKSTALVIASALLVGACAEPAPPTGSAGPGAGTGLPVPALGTMEPAVRGQFAPAWNAATATGADADAIGRLGRLYHAYEQPEHAYTCYARARDGGGAVEWTYLLGVVADELGRDEAAEAAFEAVLAANPDDAMARLRRAHARRRRGADDGALEDYEAAVAARVGLARAHHGMGAILLARGETEEALAHLRNALGIAPGFGPAWYAFATLLRETGRADDARMAFEQAATYSGEEPPWGDPRLEAVQALATGPIARLHAAVETLQRRLSRKELDEVIVILRDVVDRAPEIAEGHAQLGAALLLAGDGPGARAALSRAVALAPGFVEPRYNLGLLAYREERFEDAAAAFAGVLDLTPDSFDARLGQGMALAQLDRLEEGRAVLEIAIAQWPGDARPALHLGSLLRRHGLDAPAETMLRAAVARMPTNQGLRQRLADLLATSEDPAVRAPAEAVAICEALLTETTHPRVLETAATALAADGRPDEARTLLSDGAAEARSEGRLADAERLEAALAHLGGG